MREPATKKNKTAFTNLIRTDGFTADVALYAGVGNSQDVTEQSSDSTFDIQLLSDAVKPGDVDNLLLFILNPGGQYTFTASFNEEEGFHEVRKVSTVDYYNYTGSICHKNKKNRKEW